MFSYFYLYSMEDLEKVVIEMFRLETHINTQAHTLYYKQIKACSKEMGTTCMQTATY